MEANSETTTVETQPESHDLEEVGELTAPTSDVDDVEDVELNERDPVALAFQESNLGKTSIMKENDVSDILYKQRVRCRMIAVVFCIVIFSGIIMFVAFLTARAAEEQEKFPLANNSPPHVNKHGGASSVPKGKDTSNHQHKVNSKDSSAQIKALDGVLYAPQIPASAHQKFHGPKVDFGHKVAMADGGKRVAVATKSQFGEFGLIHVFRNYEGGKWAQEYSLATTSNTPTETTAVRKNQALALAPNSRRLFLSQGAKVHAFYRGEDHGERRWSSDNVIVVDYTALHPSDTSNYAHDLATSSDGKTIAILVHTNNKAVVQIFAESETSAGGNSTQYSWRHVAAFPLQKTSGSISMSYDGKRLAIGEFNERSDDPSAEVSVYQADDNNGSSWNLMVAPQTAYGPDRKLGGIVKLSGDGTTLAIGSYHGHLNTVAVAKLHEENGQMEWVQKGWVLVGNHDKSRFGATLGMNYNGQRLVVGAPGSPELFKELESSNEHYAAGTVYVYHFTKGSWLQLANPVRSRKIGDGFGWSLAMDHVGDRFIAGFPQIKDPKNDDSHGAVSIFEIEIKQG